MARVTIVRPRIKNNSNCGLFALCTTSGDPVSSLRHSTEHDDLHYLPIETHICVLARRDPAADMITTTAKHRPRETNRRVASGTEEYPAQEAHAPHNGPDNINTHYDVVHALPSSSHNQVAESTNTENTTRSYCCFVHKHALQRQQRVVCVLSELFCRSTGRKYVLTREGRRDLSTMAVKF